jgi:thiamine pyrophosphate-dependent acetolactate synthase large subunit-like protein
LAQFGINVKTVIINNGWQGMVRQWQEAFYGERYSSSNMEVGMPDFVKLAEAYGVKGMLIQSRDELPGCDRRNPRPRWSSTGRYTGEQKRELLPNGSSWQE